MSAATVKEEILRLVERLPEDATWEDVQFRIYFRQAVAAGLEDSRARRVVTQDEARRRFAAEKP